MKPQEIEAAHEPFVAALRTGGFDPPEAGWPAELVAAHVAANNELIAVVAEELKAGEIATYDNSSAIDEELLRELVERAEDLEGLAGAVEQSASRLAAAFARLGPAERERPIEIVIRDGGEVVREGAVSIGKFIEGNATFHLDAHHAQLQALLP